MTVTPELNEKANKHGLKSIRLRITINKQHKRFNLGVEVKEADWNPNKKEVRRHHEKCNQINRNISKITVELKNLQAEHSFDTPLALYDAFHFNQNLVTQNEGDSFCNFAKQLQVESKHKHGTSLRYGVVVSKLKRFKKDNPISFKEIDHEFVLKFQKWMSEVLINNTNTVTQSLKVLKTIFNEGKHRGLVSKALNPFEFIKFKHAKTTRSRLNEEQIYLIENATLPHLPWQNARNLFMFQFYLHGMRISDALMLTWHNIKGDRLEYIMKKTGKTKSVLIHENAKKILDTYALPQKGMYIFPFLKNQVFADEKEAYNSISSATAYVNKLLRQIQQHTKLDAHLSSHVARHTFANLAKNRFDVHRVSAALGHSSIVVTESYFNAASNEQLDDINSMF
jgi:site-specific recombinase XerD